MATRIPEETEEDIVSPSFYRTGVVLRVDKLVSMKEIKT
jgi:hypothetical protein